MPIAETRIRNSLGNHGGNGINTVYQVGTPGMLPTTAAPPQGHPVLVLSLDPAGLAALRRRRRAGATG
jgi:hypothetical protein